MQHASLSRLTALLGGLSLSAMGLTTMCLAQSQPVVAHATQPSSCPVMVTAKYVPGAALRPVAPAADSVSRQPLHLTFGTLTKEPRYGLNLPGPPTEVREAKVTVRGITEKGGLIPAGVSSSSPLLQKTFTISVTRNPAGVLTSTIWLTGFGGVSDVSVDALTYADGTAWRPTATESCHVTTGSVLTSSK